MGGNVTADGNATVTERGVVYATTQTPTTSNTKVVVGNGTGTFTTNITGLTAATTYYVRAYAINSQGTAYGSQQTFTTSQALSLPTVTTTAATTVTSTGASMGGNVTADGNATVTERGVVYATTQTPTTSNIKVTIGTGSGVFTSNVTGLISGTTYYVRAYAINSQGTSYGSQEHFTTSGILTIVDMDGNAYSTVNIGSQIWMKENLKTTKYNNGLSIINLADNTWADNSTSGPGPAYCWYNNLIINKNTYGALYNWYAVETGRLCPEGWHVPTEADWIILITFLGGTDFAGGKMKTTGTSLWNIPNEGATNESGFSGVPGGYRYADSMSSVYFTKLGETCQWWSQTVAPSTYNNNAWIYGLHYGSVAVFKMADNKRDGASVRCIKNN
jgi:uncharacterized protein (TIGR02145 family)